MRGLGRRWLFEMFEGEEEWENGGEGQMVEEGRREGDNGWVGGRSVCDEIVNHQSSERS